MYRKGDIVLLSRLFPQNHTPAPPLNGNQLLWPKFQKEAAKRKQQENNRKLQRENNKKTTGSCKEKTTTRPKMADLTSRGPWASLHPHCNALANETPTSTVTVGSCHWQQLEKLIQGLKRSVAPLLGPNHTPVLGYSMNISPTLSKSLPFTLTFLYIWYLHMNGVEKLICKLGSRVSVLWSLNKACVLPVSASISLLTVQIQSEKEPPWPRQGVSTQAKTPAWVQSTNYQHTK